jgi:aspartyl protease family protein
MATIDYLKSVLKQLRLLSMSCLLLSSVNIHAQNTDTPDDLYSQILSLQSQTAIQIIGMERIENEPKVVTRGNTEQQIQQLFASYNHIVSRNTKGQIERIVIVNKIQKHEVERIVLHPSHQGNHMIVPVSISGDGRVWQTVDMLIDTGADLVVLPESLINQLGLGEKPFTKANIQTANGMVEAKITQLQELKIAGESVENVQTAFVPDSLLGGNKLLGMSVLGRYQLTIDDQDKTITLFKK